MENYGVTKNTNATIGLPLGWQNPIKQSDDGVLGYNIVDCSNMIVIAFILAVYKYYYEA